MSRNFDVVIYGATGFVGKLTAKHLADVAGGARIALAGRTKAKLEAVRDELGVKWPLIIADSSDEAAVKSMVAQTKVLVTTVGPYAKYGKTVVSACAHAGTHYVDLTGEVLFVTSVIDELHDVAKESGAKIVPSCGFDSVPSDLATMRLADMAGEPLGPVVMVVRMLRGGASGGTIDSMRVQVAAEKRSAAAAAIVANPYALCPENLPTTQPADNVIVAAETVNLQWNGYLAPFFMGQYNSRVVHRSNALSGYAYGRDFTYTETMTVPRNSKAAAVMVRTMITATFGVLGNKWGQRVTNKLLPAPGEGPSERKQENGAMVIEVYGETTTGKRYVSSVSANVDPGYLGTSRMLGQAALALAFDDLPPMGGVLTPATALGANLVNRLSDQGFQFSRRHVQ